MSRVSSGNTDQQAASARRLATESMYDVSRLELAVEYLTVSGTCVLQDGFVRWDSLSDTFSFLGDTSLLLLQPTTATDLSASGTGSSVSGAAAAGGAGGRVCRMKDLVDDPQRRLCTQGGSGVAKISLLQALQYARSAFRVHVSAYHANSNHATANYPTFSAPNLVARSASTSSCTHVRIYWHLQTNRNRLTPEAAAWLVDHLDSVSMQALVSWSTSLVDDGALSDLIELVYPRQIATLLAIDATSTTTQSDSLDDDDYATASGKDAEKEAAAAAEWTYKASSELYVVAVNRRKLWSAYQASRDANCPPSSRALAQSTVRTVYSLQRRCESASEQFALSHVCAAFVSFLDNAIDADAQTPTEIPAQSAATGGVRGVFDDDTSIYHRQPFVFSAQQAVLYQWLVKRVPGSVPLGGRVPLDDKTQFIAVRRITALRVAGTQWYYDCEQKSLLFDASGNIFPQPPGIYCARASRSSAAASSAASSSEASALLLLIDWRNNVDHTDLRPATLNERVCVKTVQRASRFSFVGGEPMSGKRTAVLAAMTFGDAGYGVRSFPYCDSPPPLLMPPRFLFSTLSPALSSLSSGSFSFDGVSPRLVSSVLKRVRAERRVRDASSFSLLARTLPTQLCSAPLYVLFESLFGERSPPVSTTTTTTTAKDLPIVASALRCDTSLVLCSRSRIESWLSAIATVNRGRLWRGRVAQWYHIVSAGGSSDGAGASENGGGSGGSGGGADESENRRILFRIATVSTLSDYWQLQYADLLTCDVLVVAYEVLCQVRSDSCSYMVDFVAARHCKSFERAVWMQCLKHHMNTEQRVPFAQLASPDAVKEYNVPLEAIEWRRVIVDDLPAFRQRCASDESVGNDRNCVLKQADLHCVDRFLGVVQTSAAGFVCVQSTPLSASVARDSFGALNGFTAHSRLMVDCARSLSATMAMEKKSEFSMRNSVLYVSPTPSAAEQQLACKALFQMMCQLQDLQALRKVPLTNEQGPTTRFALRPPPTADDPKEDGQVEEEEKEPCSLVAQLKPTYRYVLHWAEQNSAVVPVIGQNLGEQLAQRAARFLSQINVDYANDAGDSGEINLDQASRPYHSMLAYVHRRRTTLAAALHQQQQQQQQQQNRSAPENGDSAPTSNNDSSAALAINWGTHDALWMRYVDQAFQIAAQLASLGDEQPLRDRPCGYRVRDAEWQAVVRYDAATSVGFALVAHVFDGTEKVVAAAPDSKITIERIPVLLQRSELLAERPDVPALPYSDVLTTVRDRHLCSFLMALSVSLTAENRALALSSDVVAPPPPRNDSQRRGECSEKNNDDDSTQDATQDAAQDDPVDSDEADFTDFVRQFSDTLSDDDDTLFVIEASEDEDDSSSDNDSENTSSSSNGADSDEPQEEDDGGDGDDENGRGEAGQLSSASSGGDGAERRSAQRYLGAINDYAAYYQSLSPEVLSDNVGPPRLARRTVMSLTVEAPRAASAADAAAAAASAGERVDGAQQSPIGHIVSAVVQSRSNHAQRQVSRSSSSSVADAVEQVRSVNRALLDKYALTLESLTNERWQTARLLVDTIRVLIGALRSHPCEQVAQFVDNDTIVSVLLECDSTIASAQSASSLSSSSSAQPTNLAALQTAVDRCYDFYVECIAQGVLVPRRLATYDPPLSVNVAYMSAMVSKLRRDTRWLARDAAFVERQRARIEQHVVTLERATTTLAALADENNDGTKEAEDCPVCLCEMDGVRALYPCGHYCCWDCHEQCNNDIHYVDEDDNNDEEDIGAAQRGVRCFSCRYVLQGEQAVVAIGQQQGQGSVEQESSAASVVAASSAASTTTSTATAGRRGESDAQQRPVVPDGVEKLATTTTTRPMVIGRTEDEDAWQQRVRNGSYNFVKSAPLLRFLIDLFGRRTGSAGNGGVGGTTRGRRMPVRVVVFSQFAPLLDEVCTAFRAAAHEKEQVAVYFNPTMQTLLNSEQDKQRYSFQASAGSGGAVGIDGAALGSGGNSSRKRKSAHCALGPLGDLSERFSSGFQEQRQEQRQQERRYRRQEQQRAVESDIVVFQHVDLTHRCSAATVPMLALSDMTHVVFVESLCPRLTDDRESVLRAKQIEHALLSKLCTRFSRYMLSVVRLVLPDSVDEFLYTRHLAAE